MTTTHEARNKRVKGNNDSYVVFTDRIIRYSLTSRDLPAFITRYLPCAACFREKEPPTIVGRRINSNFCSFLIMLILIFRTEIRSVFVYSDIDL